MFICVHSFQYPEKKKTEKSEAKNLCVEVHWGGGGGVRGTQLKKDDHRFLFSGFDFSEFKKISMSII